ncbi:MAG: O-antigen ligase family protein, partial [Candidatus Binatia bacterium]
DRRLLTAWVAVVLASAASFSIPAIAQGYAGDFASGPFSHKNELGAALVGPLVLAAAVALAGRPRGLRWLALAALPLIGRALMFSLSRGALVAALAGLGVVAVGLFSERRLRRVLLSLLPLALVGALLLLARSDRPVVAELLTATAGTEDANMQFRMQERWPHFTAMIVAHPWFGTGEGRDLTLGDDMNTPHNGYLSLALIHGIPAAAMVILFGVAGMNAGVRVLRSAGDPSLRALGIGLSGAIAALLVHNLVDATLYNAFAGKLYWMLSAVALVLARRPGAFAAAGPAPEAPVTAPAPVASPYLGVAS